MSGRRQVDEPPALADQRRYPIDKDKMPQVIRAKLRFEAIVSVTEWCGHYSGVGDDDVERVRFRQQSTRAGTHAFQIGEVEFNQFEASAIRRGGLAHLLR